MSRKVLIITQKVDVDDVVLGFFHDWLRVFSESGWRFSVICLERGKVNLPSGTEVFSLGKEVKPVSRLVYAWRFYKLLWRLHGTYDSVLVHMNEEYLILAGFLWRILGRRVVLWRNHKIGSWRTRLAVWFSNSVGFTSPEAFVSRYRKAIKMPVGIDTQFFVKGERMVLSNSVLFLGRLDPVKKVEVFVEALKRLPVPFQADIYGNSTQMKSDYVNKIFSQAQSLVNQGRLNLHPGVPYKQTLGLYQSHAIYVNLTPSGSFDKTIGEAMAAGCLVVCSNRAVQEIVPSGLMVSGDDIGDVMRGIAAAFNLPEAERVRQIKRQLDFVERNHSLQLLAKRLAEVL